MKQLNPKWFPLLHSQLKMLWTILSSRQPLLSGFNILIPFNRPKGNRVWANSAIRKKMQTVWTLSVRVLTCRLVQKVGEQAAHDGLVTDDQNVLLPLQLHDGRLQTLHQVFIGLEWRGQGSWLQTDPYDWRGRVTDRQTDRPMRLEG